MILNTLASQIRVELALVPIHQTLMYMCIPSLTTDVDVLKLESPGTN